MGLRKKKVEEVVETPATEEVATVLEPQPGETHVNAFVADAQDAINAANKAVGEAQNKLDILAAKLG